MNRSQQTIFLAIFLAASLIANLFLFAGNNSKASRLEQQSIELASRSKEAEQLTLQMAENKRIAQQNENTLSSVGGQQRELQAIAKEMQTQLIDLTGAYQQSLKTAEQTQQQLENAETLRKTLEARLKAQQQNLQDAQKVISNQQRLIRSYSLADDSEAELKIQQALSSLSGQLKAEYAKVILRQTQSGSGVIEIPLEYLFEPGTTKLSADSTGLMKIIAETLKSLPDTHMQIIGHSDSRPTVSELGRIYPTNWELSSARASKVAQLLQKTGIEEKQMTVIGKAATEPVREEENEQAWRVNRRVEIQFN